MNRNLSPACVAWFFVTLATGTACLLAPQSAIAKDAADSKKALESTLLPTIERHKGDVALAVEHLRTGESYAYHGDQAMGTASLIKFPVMVTAYHLAEDGKVSLDDKIELKADDKVGGSGLLGANMSPGTILSLRDAIRLMIAYSDNTATNLVIDKIGLPSTNEYMKSLGCNETQLNSKVFRRDTSLDPERSRKYGLGNTSPNDLIKLLEKLEKRELVSKEASEKMLEHMYACDDKIKSPKLLPPGTKVAHKTGSVTDIRTDTGIMDTPSGPIAFAILTNNNKDHRWVDDNDGDVFCAEIASAIYKYFNPKAGASVAAIGQPMKVGAEGDLVMALQRTLNARMKPAPGIGVDGDFGPETETAVKKFQADNKLDATGIVDAATWKALGSIVMEEEPADEATVSAVEVADKKPLDPLDGPPIVTCKAWAVVDGATGKLLAGYHEDEPRDPASTTKIMTAYLVTSLAEKHPEVLDEIVTFSQKADDTSGSTSGVKAGEKVSVGELLYGLLLPSGNDASVALAEHFGGRVAGDAKAHDDADENFKAFVEAMNHKAVELGMKGTHYKNTHGLTAKGHQTTARDMGHLAFLALKEPEFGRRVSTPEHKTTVDSIAGYHRDVDWKSTNQLLKIKGFDGVKTGTTGAAGCCLVSSGERDGHHLIIVVLGSTSTESRYADARNLYRWAWKDLVGIKLGDDSQKQAKAN